MQVGRALFTEWSTERDNRSYSLHWKCLLNGITYHVLEQLFMVFTSQTFLSSAERSTESGFKLQPSN